MHKRNQGFTIVELLIVIVLIAILSSVTAVAYTGVQKRANNTSRVSDVSQVMTALEGYKALHGEYPDFTNGTFLCAGTGFPNGRCRDYKTTGSYSYPESNREATDMLAEFSTLSTSHVPAGDSVGPLFDVWDDGWGFGLVMYVQGEEAQGAPCTVLNNGFLVWWNDPSSDRLMCGKDYPSDYHSDT